MVEQTKKSLIKLTGVGQRRRNIKRRIKEDTKQIIEEYWRVNEHKLFTVKDVRRHIKEKEPSSSPPLSTFIAGYMKTSMKLSYKKVSWRPLEVQSSEITNHQNQPHKLRRESTYDRIQDTSNRWIYGIQIDLPNKSVEDKRSFRICHPRATVM